MALSAAVLCVALTVFHEARGEPMAGKLAVAHVINNRAHGNVSRYCSVVHSKGQFSVKGKSRVDFSSGEWRDSLAVARSFRSFPDLSHGATHFHEKKVRPRWRKALRLVSRVGAHLFYKGV